ncbi:hypothetical protein [Propionivibrio sp.]|uniref:hypothetical protein n=1 Tax=Propionivibrio sp. TaxID=2212460 RepID=UPI0039E38A14
MRPKKEAMPATPSASTKALARTWPTGMITNSEMSAMISPIMPLTNRSPRQAPSSAAPPVSRNRKPAAASRAP